MTRCLPPFDLSRDQLSVLVEDDRRLPVLACLIELAEPIGLDDFVDRLSTHLGSSAAEKDRLALELHHVHLPKLSAVGFVEYDAEEGVVRADDSVVNEESFLDLDRWFSAGA